MINTLFFSFLVFILVSFYPVNCGYFANSNSEPISEVQQKDESDFVSIVAVGDIMIGSTYPQNILPADDAISYFKNVDSILQDADITFGNLEGTLFNGTGKVKKCSDPSICYSFKMPEHYVDRIKDAGFDWLSIANNHIGDFGRDGINSTVNILEKSKLKYAGLKEYPYSLDTINGLIYAFTAFAPNNETLDINNYQFLDSIVKALDSISNIVIVSFHGGAEGRKFKHIERKDELFLNEKRGNPYKFARVAIDAGADLILGHGPHVTRAVDVYKNRFIAYSLGNFATFGRFNLKKENGFAPILKIKINNKGEFQEATITSIKQIGKGVPAIDSTNQAFFEMKKLTNIDFPETKLSFDSTNYKVTVIR